jgi:hypothetical protein
MSTTTTNLWDTVNNVPPRGDWNGWGSPTFIGGHGPGASVGDMLVSRGDGGTDDLITFNLESGPGGAAQAIMMCVSHGRAAHDEIYGPTGGNQTFTIETDTTVETGNFTATYTPLGGNSFQGALQIYTGNSLTVPSTITLKRTTDDPYEGLIFDAVGVYIETGGSPQDPIPAGCQQSAIIMFI